MRLRAFIKLHRAELDEVIKSKVGRVPRTASCFCSKSGTDHQHPFEGRINDEERRQWVLSDEGLYRWAQSEVKDL